MAHFAKISETNEVLTVLTLNNSDMLNLENVETETVGQAYLEKHNNWPLHLWIQTSYNTQMVELHLEEIMRVGVILGTKIIIFSGLKNLMHLG